MNKRIFFIILTLFILLYSSYFIHLTLFILLAQFVSSLTKIYEMKKYHNIDPMNTKTSNLHADFSLIVSFEFMILFHIVCRFWFIKNFSNYKYSNRKLNLYDEFIFCTANFDTKFTLVKSDEVYFFSWLLMTLMMSIDSK